MCTQDNQSTILVSTSDYSSKLRHVARAHRVDLSCVAEVLESAQCDTDYCVTDKQAADIFTKALEPQKLGPALKMIGVTDGRKNKVQHTT